MLDQVIQPLDRPIDNQRKWLWQCSIIFPDEQPMEYPICPFCSESPFLEKNQDPPDRCPSCGEKLEI